MMCSITKSWKIISFSTNIFRNNYYRTFLRATSFNYHTFNSNQSFLKSVNNYVLLNPNWSQYNLVRHKKKKVEPKSVAYDEEEEEEEEEGEGDSVVGRNIESKTITVNFLRIDAIMKHGFNISRAKLEKAFYENRFRLNGRKVLKKSTNVQPGDEVDLIRDVSKENKDFLIVSRLEIISAKPNEKRDALSVKIRRTKLLTIENYQDDPWRHATDESS